ncbi:hypothetical protein GM920_06495 [Pedobacter sp. LMG 31462]|uniref:Uncharacterized protein n=2 Tax=Pedobacter gandavensis TaxID=2679963 RepID=A0ABR6EUQ2_9SPHI|nr:hypothetical protein [Pedobacter gandavensis]
MAFLPYEQLSYKSPLKIDDAIERLGDKIDPYPSLLNWKFGKLDQPFKGTMDGNEFVISKITSINMGIHPYFYGEIRENEAGSIIHIVIRPFIPIIVFSALFGGLVLLIGFLNDFILPRMLFPLGITLFIYTVLTASFKFQASFIKDDLMEIFEVKAV